MRRDVTTTEEAHVRKHVENSIIIIIFYSTVRRTLCFIRKMQDNSFFFASFFSCFAFVSTTKIMHLHICTRWVWWMPEIFIADQTTTRSDEIVGFLFFVKNFMQTIWISKPWRMDDANSCNRCNESCWKTTPQFARNSIRFPPNEMHEYKRAKQTFFWELRDAEQIPAAMCVTYSMVAILHRRNVA